MAVTTFSPLLGLALPTTGDLSGTWGTTVNDAITSLLDSAVAGTTTLSADASVTLTTTDGAANQSRSAVILWTASNGATTRTVTAPAHSKAYIVINAGTGSVIIKGAGTVSPYDGVTIASGYKALVAWNGTDFVKIASSLVNLTSDVTGTLPIANGGTGTTSTTYVNLASNVTGQLPIANGGTGTATPAIVAGTNVTVSGSWPNQTINAAAAAQVYPNVGIANSTGTAWGTSYTTSGSGTVLALATGATLTSCTVDGTNLVGYQNIPINSQSADYTLVLADAGKSIFHPGTDANDRTFTIPANASVAYPLGTAISFLNMSANNVSIAITSDTMYLSGYGYTGTRTLAQYGAATAVKMTSTTWMISGNGLS
jgi:hypothetical protein